MAITIEDLVDDVLGAIITALLALSASETSRRCRAICMPTLFRQITFNLSAQARGTSCPLPSKLWDHIRTLHLKSRISLYGRFSGKDPLGSLILDACDHSLPSFALLPNLHTVLFYGVPEGPWPALLFKVLDAPSLKTLEWRNSPLRSHEPVDLSPLSQFPPLRRILYDSQILFKDYSAQEGALYSILERASIHLEYLALAGEVVNFGRIAALDWSSLRELVLVERVDREIPLISFLECLPRLRVLDVQHSWSLPLLVWPPSFEIKSQNVLQALQRLSLTNVDPEDHILQHIPPGLTALSIVSFPRDLMIMDPQLIRSRPRSNIAMTASKIEMILTKNDVAFLTWLKLSIHGVLDLGLFTKIAIACPLLEILEVFRQRTTSAVQVDESCSEIGAALSPLTQLSVVRIAFDFTDAPDKYGGTDAVEYFDHGSLWAREKCLDRAREFAHNCGPKLREVTFSRRRMKKTYWFGFDIERDSKCRVVDVIEKNKEWECI